MMPNGNRDPFTGRYSYGLPSPRSPLEPLARKIAEARHGTDVMWPNYMAAAKSAAEWCAGIADAEIGIYPELNPGYTAACEAVADKLRNL